MSRKDHGLALGVLLLLLLFVPSVSTARPEVEALSKAIWRIRAENSPFCGTGFLIGTHRLLTTAHLVKSLCPFLRCNKLLLDHSNFLGEIPSEIPKIVSPHLALLLESIDVAVLDLNLPLAQKSEVLLLANSGASQGEQAYALSYADCSSLKIHSGIITQVDGIHLETDLPIRHGASGSPLFNDQGQVIGLIEQANSLIGAVRGILFGENFSARAVILRQEFFQSPIDREAILRAQLDQLLAHYTTDVSQKLGFERAFAGLQFYGQVHQLGKDMLRAGFDDQLMPFLALGAKLDEVPLIEEKSSLQENVLALVVAANLERNGLRRSNFSTLEIGEVREYFSSVSSLGEVFDAYEPQPQRGFYHSFIRASRLLVFPLAAFIALWGISLGYTWRDLQGKTLWKRIFLSGLIGIFAWPLSFAAYLVMRRKPTDRKPAD